MTASMRVFAFPSMQAVIRPLVGIGSIGCSGRRYGETVGLRQGYLFVAEQAGSGGESFFRIASGYRLPVAVDAELGGAV